MYYSWPENPNIKIELDNASAILPYLERIKNTNWFWQLFLTRYITGTQGARIVIGCKERDAFCDKPKIGRSKAPYFKFIESMYGDMASASDTILRSLEDARKDQGITFAREAVNDLFGPRKQVTYREVVNKALSDGRTVSKANIDQASEYRGVVNQTHELGKVGKVDPEKEAFLYEFFVWLIRVAGGEPANGWIQARMNLKMPRDNRTKFRLMAYTIAASICPWLEPGGGGGEYTVKVDLKNQGWAGSEMDNPLHVILLHELIHAHHYATGRGFNNRIWEEAQTVGLHPFSDVRYSENDYRSDHNLRKRVIYNTRDNPSGMEEFI
jgi:hypothetical protein